MHLSAYMQVRWFSLLWIFKVITDIQSKALYNTSCISLLFTKASLYFLVAL